MRPDITECPLCNSSVMFEPTPSNHPYPPFCWGSKPSLFVRPCLAYPNSLERRFTGKSPNIPAAATISQAPAVAADCDKPMKPKKSLGWCVLFPTQPWVNMLYLSHLYSAKGRLLVWLTWSSLNNYCILKYEHSAWTARHMTITLLSDNISPQWIDTGELSHRQRFTN